MKDIKELALKVAKEMNWRMDEMTLETFATRLIAAYHAEQEPVSLYPCGFKELNSLVIKNGAYLARGMYEGEPVTESIRSAAMVLIGYAKDMSILLAKQPLYAAPPEPAPECKHEFVTTFGGDYCIKCNVPAPSNDFPAAAPSSEEVTKMVARLYGDLDGGPSSWLKQEAAAFIERLAARVDDLKQANDGLATAGILPDGCVVVPREATDEMLLAAESVKQYELSTPRLRWEAMIAAWEVKP